MPKKRQTRRAVSLKGLTYQRLQAYCYSNELSVSGYLEDLIRETLDAAGQPEETVLRPRPEAKKPETYGASGIFTW